VANSQHLKLAHFLKNKRIVSGFSQKDVATQLGYSTSQFISNWERGISQPPLSTLRKLALVYKIDADQMFNAVLEATIAQVEMDLKRKFYSNDVSV
jgi:transcriptional regulator with XRE-family HTH domain